VPNTLPNLSLILSLWWEGKSIQLLSQGDCRILNFEVHASKEVMVIVVYICKE
jgi:hypothetical protein